MGLETIHEHSQKQEGIVTREIFWHSEAFLFVNKTLCIIFDSIAV